jgi:hypothetical protein
MVDGAWPASRPGYFTPGTGPRSRSGHFGEVTISCSCGDSNDSSAVVQSVAWLVYRLSCDMVSQSHENKMKGGGGVEVPLSVKCVHPSG